MGCLFPLRRVPSESSSFQLLGDNPTTQAVCISFRRTVILRTWMSSREINKKAAVSATSIHSFRKKALQPARTLPLPESALHAHGCLSSSAAFLFFPQHGVIPWEQKPPRELSHWSGGLRPRPVEPRQKASSHRTEARVGLPGCKSKFRRLLLPSLCGDDTGCCLQHHKRKYPCPLQGLLEAAMP